MCERARVLLSVASVNDVVQHVVHVLQCSESCIAVCCSLTYMLRCVAVICVAACCSHMCCSVLQSYVCSTCSVSSHVLQCVTLVRVAVAVCCSVLQRVAVICVAACCSHVCVPRAVYRVMCCSMLQSYICAAACCSHMCCSVLQSYVCCSVLQAWRATGWCSLP